MNWEWGVLELGVGRINKNNLLNKLVLELGVGRINKNNLLNKLRRI